jgi:hypothetical protein
VAQADSVHHVHTLRRVLEHALQLAEQAGREQDAFPMAHPGPNNCPGRGCFGLHRPVGGWREAKEGN